VPGADARAGSAAQGCAEADPHAIHRVPHRALQHPDRVRITDLRMGQEPDYVFAFEVATRHSALQPLVPSVAVGGRGDPAPGLQWLWRRLRGEPVAPPS
jgi:inner membrane protein